MPASSSNLYHMQDARNNFDAMRPAPICADAKQLTGQYQNIHISRNCYYGYHDPKSAGNAHVITDCEMVEAPPANGQTLLQNNNRKRSAEDNDYPQIKRLREEVQREKKIERETSEIKTRSMDRSEELLESMYWNTHGGNFYHLLQCRDM